MQAWLRNRLAPFADAALPFVVGLLFALLVAEEAGAGIPGWLVALGALAALAQGIALRWRRSHPIAVMAITLAGGVFVLLLAADIVFPYAALVAIFALAAARGAAVSLPALAGLLAVTALNFGTAPSGDAWFAMAVAVIAWALGEAARSRRVAIEEASRRAIGEEQARIARELHDVIAHSVSVIVVQAAAADDVFDRRPDRARAALRSIEVAGRDALGELRRLLGAVGPGADSGQLLPAPGLDRLAELAQPLREAGLEVKVHRQGGETIGELPAGVDLSAYRIAQEALTNALRHSGARRAEVTVSAADGMLELEVVDDGRGTSASAQGEGRGIAGMRERAALLGGTLEVGPRLEGGFRVHARLPMEPTG